MLTVESGRSMVEMLGVLAIIGVLSVGGIAGYKTAMERHQANQLLNALNIMEVEAGAADVTPKYENWGKKINTLNVNGLTVDYDINSFTEAGYAWGYLHITGVTPSDTLCKALANWIFERRDKLGLYICRYYYETACSFDTSSGDITNISVNKGDGRNEIVCDGNV